jgi:excinuclease ABC subunit C
MALRWPYIKRMPNGPGVYIFLEKNNTPLYIGRATYLKRRVLSYFNKPQDYRIREMVSRAASIKYRKTDNLLEAVVLEANLIKKHWPKYNVREKDNRSFTYIVIPKTDFPRPLIARKRELEKFPQDRVFGPYQSLSLIKNALRIIRRIFPYSTCKIGGGKPCFDYQIGLCPGACIGAVSKENYKKNIDNIILLLKGENKKLFRRLKKENLEKISALKYIQDVSLIKDEFKNSKLKIKNSAKRIEGYDISHFSGKETYGSMVVFLDNKPDKSHYRLFKIKEAPANDDLRALQEAIIRRFRHREWRFPDLILIDGGKPQVSFISKTLKTISVPVPLVGISKFGGDELVFPPQLKKSTKELIETNKNILLKVREEAHRFAIKFSRRKLRKI